MADFQKNLTTDACPSPPRDDLRYLENDETNDDVKGTEKPLHNKKTKKQNDRKRQGRENKYVINISNSKGVHIGSNYTINVNRNDSPKRNCDDFPMSEAINKLLNTDEFVSTDDLIFVSNYIDETWRDVGRYFNFSEGEIDQLYENHIQNGIKEVIYQLLLTWLQQEPREAKIGRLATALWCCGQKDAVKKWSERLEETKL